MPEFITPFVTLLAAGGVIRVLWSIRAELSQLRAEFHTFRTQNTAELADHENRIRRLERPGP